MGEGLCSFFTKRETEAKIDFANCLVCCELQVKLFYKVLY